MSLGHRQMLLKAFSQFKDHKILWKWETEEMENKPDNIKLVKWLPQPDVLGHQNTVLFVTHGGQSSVQEAHCHKKPTVGKVPYLNPGFIHNIFRCLFPSLVINMSMGLMLLELSGRIPSNRTNDR